VRDVQKHAEKPLCMCVSAEAVTKEEHVTPNLHRVDRDVHDIKMDMVSKSFPRLERVNTEN
jgi:hypothetical protein